MLRVLIYSDTRQFAGIERHIVELASALRHAGVEVAIGCREETVLAARVREAGLSILPMGGRGLLDVHAVWKILRFIRDGNIDVVHVHNGRTALAASLAVRLAGFGCCVATQHFLNPQHVARRGIGGLLYRAAHRWVNRQVDQFIAISQAVREQMLRRGDADIGRISLIPNGISDLATHKLKLPAQIRAALSIGPADPLIVCPARLETEKDIGTLIAAMRHVAAACPTARCLIAGDGSERQALTELIDRLSLHENVRLLGFRADVPSLINAADVLVLPSLVESFGLVLLEAMSLSKPVVATRCGGPEEVVAERESGLLVEPRNPEALAHALRTLLPDSQLRWRMGESGRRRFLARYTAERMAKETLNAYEAALFRGRERTHRTPAELSTEAGA